MIGDTLLVFVYFFRFQHVELGLQIGKEVECVGRQCEQRIDSDLVELDWIQSETRSHHCRNLGQILDVDVEFTCPSMAVLAGGSRTALERTWRWRRIQMGQTDGTAEPNRRTNGDSGHGTIGNRQHSSSSGTIRQAMG